MFYLHVSNRTENLLRHLCEVIRADRHLSLFHKELFLIQSQGMERMVAQTLADEFVSFCNFQFLLPLDFLKKVAEKLEMAISPDGFGRQILTWRLDQLLRDLDLDVYQPVRKYLAEDNCDLKRYQLAARLANLFDQYQLMRGDMLTRWQEGQTVTANPAEGWQMDLWCRLLEQPEGNIHRGVLFQKVITRLYGADDVSPLLPKRVSVIGVHTMPPVFLQYLNGLARHMDVHLFVLSPCEKYWGNIESMKKQYRRLLSTPTKSSDAIIEHHHPLLAALGKQGRDLQNMMLEMADFSLEFASYENPLVHLDYCKAPLLARIQADLLKTEIGIEAPLINDPEDRSVRLVCCHSELRELMVLKDHLLDLLHGDSRLELRDIIVMAPDIQEYESLIPAVFSDIQHSIADRSIRRRNSVTGAFVSFLELFSGRFGVSEVMDVLQQPTIHPQFNLLPQDLDVLRGWVSEAGIRWGLSAEHRQDLGLTPFEESSWRAGLDRLLMGFAVDSDGFIDGVLPFDEVEGTAGAPLGGLCSFISLLERGYRDFGESHPAKQWSALLQDYISHLFGDQGEQDLVELLSLVAELGDTVDFFHNGEISFDVICEWLAGIAKESRSSSGFLRGQLTFCSMLPMRSIPFQVVCLIGLNDGVFPRNDTHDTFDLMSAEVRPGDRSPRSDDRYQFLEAILAARSTLYISYVGQSKKTNERIPPSVVVDEFVEMLEQEYGMDDPVTFHPLHPFSRRYFVKGKKEPGLFSHDTHYCAIAQAFSQKVTEQRPWWQGELETVDEEVRLGDLVSFYKNPPRYFIKNCLGIELSLDKVMADDRELFEVAGLDKYMVEQYLLEKYLDEDKSEPEDLKTVLKKVQAMGYWPLGEAGELSFAKTHAQLDGFATHIKTLGLGCRLPDLSLDAEIGDQHLAGTLSGVYEHGILLVRLGNLRGQDLLQGWIHHLVANHARPGTTTYIVATDSSLRIDAATSEETIPKLVTLLSYYKLGCTSPIPFYVEPAFAYVKQLTSKRARIPPLAKAVEKLQVILDSGYQPEWELLLEGGVAFDTVEFEHLATSLLLPVWEAVHGR